MISSLSLSVNKTLQHLSQHFTTTNLPTCIWVLLPPYPPIETRQVKAGLILRIMTPDWREREEGDREGGGRSTKQFY